MNRTSGTLALAALLAGAGLAGCGGTSTPPGDAQVTAAVRASASEYDPQAQMDDERERDGAVSSFLTMLDQLARLPALAPLFQEYQVAYPIVVGDDDASAGLIALLRAVRITVSGGDLVVTNRATGAVIYSAPVADLGAGTFDPQNLPTTGATQPPPPAATCTAFTYSAWGACQPDGTQTRTVASSSPAGCTGTPVLSQSCTYAAPNPVTVQDVVSSCTMCHGLTSNTTVFRSGGYTVSGRSAAQWLTTVDTMVGMGASLAPGTTAQDYAGYLANVP